MSSEPPTKVACPSTYWGYNPVSYLPPIILPSATDTFAPPPPAAAPPTPIQGIGKCLLIDNRKRRPPNTAACPKGYQAYVGTGPAITPYTPTSGEISNHTEALPAGYVNKVSSVSTLPVESPLVIPPYTPTPPVLPPWHTDVPPPYTGLSPPTPILPTSRPPPAPPPKITVPRIPVHIPIHPATKAAMPPVVSGIPSHGHTIAPPSSNKRKKFLAACPPNQPEILVLGDSHSRIWENIVEDEEFVKRRVWLTNQRLPGCSAVALARESGTTLNASTHFLRTVQARPRAALVVLCIGHVDFDYIHFGKRRDLILQGLDPDGWTYEMTTERALGGVRAFVKRLIASTELTSAQIVLQAPHPPAANDTRIVNLNNTIQAKKNGMDLIPLGTPIPPHSERTAAIQQYCWQLQALADELSVTCVSVTDCLVDPDSGVVWPHYVRPWADLHLDFPSVGALWRGIVYPLICDLPEIQ